MVRAHKRRIRSPHPGVVLLDRRLPSGRVGVQARYRDPDTGKLRKPMLDLTALPTQEARALWAKRMSKEIARRRMDLEAGAPRLRPVPLADALKQYRTACTSRRLRGNTLAVYDAAAKTFEAWAKSAGINSTRDLTPASLAGYREHLTALRARESVAEGGRGERRDSDAKRLSPSSVNIKLRAGKTMLTYFRAHGLAAQLTRDAITDALKPLPLPRRQPKYLAPSKIEKLMQAAAKHDAATFAATREELALRAAAGMTTKHKPIASFVAFLLLTGCRRGEALGLKWSDVDLEAKDHDRKVVGEIRLRAEDTKTHHERTIGLEVSPALRTMLAAMKLRAKPKAVYVFGYWAAPDDAPKGSKELVERPYTVDLIEAARARLVDTHGAPKFEWQTLRSTCSTYLTNAPGIFGAATVFLSARQLGHSVQVAEKHYLGVHRGIPKDAHSLEAAMQIEAQLHKVLEAVERLRPGAPTTLDVSELDQARTKKLRANASRGR